MSSNKKHWLFHLLALIAIVILVPANCREDKADKEPSEIKKPANTKHTREAPKNTDAGQPVCADDEDCSSGSCLKGVCIAHPTDDEENGEVDDEDKRDVVKSCATAETCGCGFDCVNSKCHKLDSSCCTDTDCGAGLVCFKKDGEQNGECMLSQCETDDQCGGRCGTHCENHRCNKSKCCIDIDCPTGEFCQLYHDAMEGYCKTVQCTSNADCGCGEVCAEHSCTHSYSSESPMKCCGTDVSVNYHYDETGNWTCVPHERIENGNCVEDANCPRGQVCYSRARCLPANCTENSDCGCEKVCRKGRCEFGCDKTSDCCNKGDTCDRGSCYDSSGNQTENY